MRRTLALALLVAITLTACTEPGSVCLHPPVASHAGDGRPELVHDRADPVAGRPDDPTDTVLVEQAHCGVPDDLIQRSMHAQASAGSSTSSLD